MIALSQSPFYRTDEHGYIRIDVEKLLLKKPADVAASLDRHDWYGTIAIITKILPLLFDNIPTYRVLGEQISNENALTSMRG